ncbi:uncharacterized protein METZ01_LOCUS365148, partial [marine metagenome]
VSASINNDAIAWYENDGAANPSWSAFDIIAGGVSAVKASLEFDGTLGQYPSLVQVDSDTYICAYNGQGNDLWLSTFTVSADGSSITEVATREVATLGGWKSPSITQIDSDTYAVAYSGQGDDGFISTYTVPTDGSSISDAVATLEYNTNYAVWHSNFIQVDSDTYLLANSNQGDISAFTISADGSSITESASLTHNAGSVTYNSLVQVDSDTYALAYKGDDNDGFVTTFTVPSNGGSITEVATLEYDTGKSEWNSIIQIDSDTYLVSYSGPDDDGFVCTIYISADGSTISKVASFEFETSYATSTALC